MLLAQKMRNGLKSNRTLIACLILTRSCYHIDETLFVVAILTGWSTLGRGSSFPLDSSASNIVELHSMPFGCVMILETYEVALCQILIWGNGLGPEI